MPNETLQDAVTLADADEMDLEDAERETLGQIVGDSYDTRNGFNSLRSTDVTRGFTNTTTDVSR